MSEDITYEVKDRSVVITLNLSKKLNALNGTQYLKLAKLVDQANEEEDTVATFIQSSGRFFSAGADFMDKGISQAKTEELFSHEYWLDKFVSRNTYITNVFNNHKKVLVAVVNGPVIGLSSALVALCDLIYVMDDSKFYMLCPFSNLGLVCEGATSATLFTRLGWSKASEALLFSRPIPGPELKQLGFINKSYNDYKFNLVEDFNAQVFKDVTAMFEHLHEDSIFKNKQLLKANRDQIVHAANSKEVVMGLYQWILGVPQDMSSNLPNPSLLGIILVISTHNGPQLVFKYPNVLSVKSQLEELENDEYKVHNTDSEESSDEEWDTRHYNYYSGTKKDLLLFLDDQEKHRVNKDVKDKDKPRPSVSGLGISRSHRPTKSEDSISLDTLSNLRKTHSGVSDQQSSISKISVGKPETNTIFGIEQDYLTEMLCPPKEMCNGRFEINIDDYIFLGLPIHSYDNGTWKKKTKLPSNADSSTLEDSVNSPRATSLNLFHLVFIMNPPVIESNYRIDEMYHYVVSRLSLVLRHEQLKHDYVWSQVKLVSKLKEEFKNQNVYSDLNSFLIDKSTLCKLISDCYTAIRDSEIANLSINNKLRSFQIPVKTEFHSLPESTVPYLPGSHLSSTVNLMGKTGLINVGETSRYGMTNTMSMIMGGNIVDHDTSDINDEDADSSADDIIYLALLLLDDPETIIKDIRAEPDSVLSNFIRMIKPTESLYKLGQKLKTDSTFSLDISQIKSFAFHLIYWRRAGVISPLNTRSVYIVSPLAPITTNMYDDITKFKMAFPSMPSLPQFLSLLSSPTKKPRQFTAIIPSKDHRQIYLDALAWLIRYGYVTKLNTFVWLKVSKKVKIKVEEDMENEALNLHIKKPSAKKAVKGTDNTSKIVEKSKDNTNPSSYEKDIEDIALEIKTINHGPEIVLDDDDDTIILDPGRANALERRWINKIVTEECKLSPELTSVFYSLLKYMNGKTSIDMMVMKSNVSRNDFRKLLLQLEDYIISVRHW